MKFLLFFLFYTSIYISQGIRIGQNALCYSGPGCGPRNWQGVCNSGKKQSPVDINTDRVRNAGDANLFFNRDYLVGQPFNLTNTGRTVQVSIGPNLTSTSTITGSNFNGKYVFSHLNFHWGSNNRQGSEHSDNGERYPMEGHLVHYSSKFENLTEAIQSNKTNAVSAIALFFLISKDDNPALEPIVKALQKLSDAGDTANGSDLNLGNLFPDSKFYNMLYEGSLTTPNCEEVVLWQVFYSGVPVSQKQLNEFRNMKDGENEPMENNFRPTQPLNDRIIKAYKTQLRYNSKQ